MNFRKTGNSKTSVQKSHDTKSFTIIAIRQYSSSEITGQRKGKKPQGWLK